MEEGIISVDIGGSHVTVAAGGPHHRPRLRRALDPRKRGTELLATVVELIEIVAGSLPPSNTLSPVAISVPGPFDYERGIFQLRGSSKFGLLFGHDFGRAIRNRLGPEKAAKIHFFNDAHCFAVGESKIDDAKGNTLAITLGTGLGSGFIINGRLAVAGSGLPALGHLYNQPFAGALADDSFSTRGLLNLYRNRTGLELDAAAPIYEKALRGEREAIDVFAQFGKDLGTFLASWLTAAGAKRLALGGNISRSGELFNPFLLAALEQHGVKVELAVCPDSEGAALIGAATLCREREVPPTKPRRKSAQPVLPLVRPAGLPSGQYDIYPAIDIGEGKVHPALAELAERFAHATASLVIDGYQGIFWQDIQAEFDQAFIPKGIFPQWICVDSALRPAEAINDLLRPFQGEAESIFGRRFTGNLADFFDATALSELLPIPGTLTILYGCGAALAGWKAPIVYVDLPKNEIQFRQRTGSILNLGVIEPLPPGAAYKRSYFVDWIALNAHKRELLPRLAAWVDGQRDSVFPWIEGDDLRAALHQVCRQPFRARPWFEPGIWGGQWLKRKIQGLAQDVPNYAWSFELITPENGVVLSSNGYLLEFSFDLLLFQDNRAILGEAAARFGTEFPIRFDFLDTWDGDNLSIQVHPRPDYIRNHFGENFTQDETYYILDAQEGAKVYLGFTPGVAAIDVATSLQESLAAGSRWPVTDYVQAFPAQRHDLFLIPHGTIHGAGRGNLVLEISSTPYIFTFKLFDWLRLGLDGKPRPINLAHGLANLDYSLQGNVVGDTLLSRPILISEGPDWQRWALPSHERHFYSIERYEFREVVQILANGQCQILMLVEGEEVAVHAEMESAQILVVRYAETVVVPAAAGGFTLRNRSPAAKAKVVLASVKG